MSTINEQTSKPGLRLLVVDDDRHLCYLLRKHLEPEGFVLSAVHTGGEGLREGMKASHELILLDVMLPDPREDAGIDAYHQRGRIRPRTRPRARCR